MTRVKALLAGPIREQVDPNVVAYPKALPGTSVAAARGPDRQVNFRLTPPLFAELEHAAEIVRMRPTALARLLVTRGVTQILREATENA